MKIVESWSTQHVAPRFTNWGSARKPRAVYPTGELQVAIEKAEDLLNLPPNWDDEGALPVRKETLGRAIKLLQDAASFIWAKSGARLPAPHVSAGPDGSVDLHWKTPQRELLINVPVSASEVAHFYGDDYGDDRRKGVIVHGNINADLFAWLTLTD